MATFLDLCKEVRSEAGLSGDGPVSVVSQTGMYKKIVGWVAEAYDEILRHSTWSFLWARSTGVTVNGQAAYSGSELGISTLGRIYSSKFFETTSSPDVRLEWKPFEMLDEWPAASGAPRYFARRPDGKIVLYPTPDAAYAIRVDHQAAWAGLAANGDVPIIPDAKLHKIIAYKALSYYALHDENLTAKQHADIQYRALLSQMADAYGTGAMAAPLTLDDIESSIPVLV